MNAHEDTRREFLKAVAGVGALSGVWLESRHTKNEKYRALAARELKRPSPFI